MRVPGSAGWWRERLVRGCGGAVAVGRERANFFDSEDSGKRD